MSVLLKIKTNVSLPNSPSLRLKLWIESENVFLRGEALQSGTHLPFAQPLQCAVAQLAHALARNPQHVADLFERVLTAVFQAEVQTDHACIARAQLIERTIDVFGQQP